MAYNILRNAVVRNSMVCKQANGAGFTVKWEENDDLQGYEEFSGLSARGVWNRVFFGVSTSGVCYVGPTADQTPFDGEVYHLVNIDYRVDPGDHVVLPTTAKIQFQTTADPAYDADKSIEFPIIADNTYRTYSVDMSLLRTWRGNISRVRFYPFIDGAPGFIVHMRSLSVLASTAPEHVCFVGAGGSCSGRNVSDGVNIVEGANDFLKVNINGYGYQGVRLTPRSGALLREIAQDIEDKLSCVAIGGYAGCLVSSAGGYLTITADDTREASSSVVVADTAAARTLGFFDSQGLNTSICSLGAEASAHYEPIGTIRLSHAEIAQLCAASPGSRDDLLTVEPGRYQVQGGRSDFATTYRDKKLDFSGKTGIDFNNPITNNGILTYIAFSGNGETDTEARFFRPAADGSLTMFASVSFGIAESKDDAVFEKSISQRVRMGDMIGIYNAKIDSGKTEEFPNVSYFEYEGELVVGTSIGPLDMEGKGDRGLRLFAHGSSLATEVVLDIEFDAPEVVEEVIVYAEEEAVVEELNLSHVLAGGVNGGPYIEASTGLDKNGAQAPALTNLGALTDGVRNPTPTALAMHPLWLDSPFAPDDLYEQTPFTVTLDFARGIPVFFNINRVKLFFLEEDNIKFFSLQYPLTTNDEDTSRYFGFVADRYSGVYMEGKLLIPDTHPLYENPIRPTAADYTDSYQYLRYRTLELEFEPVRARTLRYEMDNYYYENDETKFTYSAYPLATSPQILEMEVYAASYPVSAVEDNFSFESSEDGETYVTHTQSTAAGATSAAYLIGYPVSYLRMHITPQSKIYFRGVEATRCSAPTGVASSVGDDAVSLNIASNDYSSSERISVVNDGDVAANYFINIASHRLTDKRCILWNKLGSAAEVATSEIGPSPSVVKRPMYALREYNYAWGAPGYVADPFWLLNTEATTYISYNHGATWQPRGNLCVDYNPDTWLDAVSELAGSYLYVNVLVDLGGVYALETLQTVVPDGYVAFIGPSYSSLDTANPSDLDLDNDFFGVPEQVRWLCFRSFSRAPADELNVPAALSYVRASLDVTHSRNTHKVRWVPYSGLTNYVFGTTALDKPCGEGWQCPQAGFTNWYAVDLEGHYRITNILVGPIHDNFGYVTDVDTVVPGTTGSAYTSVSRTNSRLAYSSSETSDITRVRWGALNAEPTDRTRWLLYKREGSFVDELVVHIEDNVNANKPLFGSVRWWSAVLNDPVLDWSTYAVGDHSIAVDYPAATGPAAEDLEWTQSLGIDHHLAKRDMLRVRFYVSDVSQMDVSSAYFMLGRNTTEDNGGFSPLEGTEKDLVNYFRWNVSEIQTTIQTGWNDVYLPFTDNFETGDTHFTLNNLLSLTSQSISSRSRIRWFRFHFAGIAGNAAFRVNIGDISIERGDYSPAKFGNGLYLVEEDYAKFPLNNFNPIEGSIEFYLNPDWSKTPTCLSCEDPREHTIFRIFNSDGYHLSLFMTGKGLRLYLSEGTKYFFLTDNVLEHIHVGQNTHIGVTWRLSAGPLEAALSIYINNVLSSMFEAEALAGVAFKKNPAAVLVLGGRAWDGVTSRRVSSVDGVIDNLRVYNYAVYDFSHSLENEAPLVPVRADELIEISVNGTDFWGSSAQGHGLPIPVQAVQPGGEFTVYIRHKEQLAARPTAGQERTSYIDILKVDI